MMSSWTLISLIMFLKDKFVQGSMYPLTSLDTKNEPREIKIIKIHPPVLIGFARNVLYRYL